MIAHAAPKGSTFTQTEIEQASKSLALHISPIAHIIVKRMATRSRSLSELYRIASEEIGSLRMCLRGITHFCKTVRLGSRRQGRNPSYSPWRTARGARRSTMLRLDYISCVLTIASTVLVGKKMWHGWLVAAANSVILCFIGIRTAQFGFVPANLFCIGLYANYLSRWRPKDLETSSLQPSAPQQEATH